MYAYWLIVLHLVGDYVLQSDWMAATKTTRSLAAAAHALAYSAPFALFFRLIEAGDRGGRGAAVVFICVTHFVIDRWRLARYVCWFKNFLAPEYTGLTDCGRATDDVMRWWHPWSECTGTGYHKSREAWLAVWLMIIADNTIHLVMNGLAFAWLTRGAL